MKRISCMILALTVTACSGTSTSNPGGSQTVQTQQRQASGAPLPAEQQLPALSQQVGNAVGSTVPNDGSYLHGAYNGKAPMMFPDNSKTDRSQLLTPEQAASKLHTGRAASVMVRGAQGTQTTMLWSQVNTGNFSPTYISSNRLVYQVVTTYTTPFTVHGNTYSSGQRTIIVDAQTGQALYGTTTGTLTSRSMPFLATPSPTPTPRPKPTPNPCIKNPRLCEAPVRTPTPAPTPTHKP